MGQMRAAFEKLADSNPEIREALDRADKNLEEELKRKKEEEHELMMKKILLQEEVNSLRRKRNKMKDIYRFTCRPQGKYSLRSGIIFADSYDEAKKMWDEVYGGTDEFIIIVKVDLVNDIVETGLYIE